MAFRRTPTFATRWEVKPRRHGWFWLHLTPAQLFIASYLVLILLGTIGLKTLPGLYAAEPLNWTNALFTATSVVCITGFTIVDGASFFTFYGQLYLLVLTQLGGLGMLAFTSSIIAALGRRLSLHEEVLSYGPLEVAPAVDHRRLLFDVVRFTFTIEGVGAVLLYLCWMPHKGVIDSIWPAIFHSISAFCNAGFSTQTDSLMSFQQSPGILCVIMVLIVLGGLGFLTLEEILLQFRHRGEAGCPRMSLHSRLVLWTTLFLIVFGWVLFTCAEWNATLRDLPVSHKIVNGLFLSVTARTAGFNSIDYGLATETTCFLTILLMMIGGSPGSTAGGIKTTTFAILGVVAWSRLRGQRATTIWNRSLREETINRTIGLVVVAFAVVVCGILMLTVTEFHPADNREKFLDHTFEVVSAFTTAGLSTGLTPTLSLASRWLIMALMFLGRVGPLTLTAALTVRYARAGRFRYAYEDVVVG